MAGIRADKVKAEAAEKAAKLKGAHAHACPVGTPSASERHFRHDPRHAYDSRATRRVCDSVLEHMRCAPSIPAVC